MATLTPDQARNFTIIYDWCAECPRPTNNQIKMMAVGNKRVLCTNVCGGEQFVRLALVVTFATSKLFFNKILNGISI